ncbi:MAG: C2H2-type zinc finger protein, partial [Cyanobacteria bacterium J06582_2]
GEASRVLQQKKPSAVKLKKHNKEKPFHCDICGKQFYSKKKTSAAPRAFQNGLVIINTLQPFSD